MKKYNPDAPPKRGEKYMVAALAAAMAIGACFFTPLVQEKISGVKYAPAGELYAIFAVCLLWNLPVMFYLLHRMWCAKTNRSLSVRMLAAMIVPIFIAALPHQINLMLAPVQTYEVSLPIKDKSRQLRTPRGGGSFHVYRLHLRFDSVPVGNKNLSGEHIVFVTEKTFGAAQRDDLFPLTLKTGPFASFMLQTDNTVNLVR
ncbi:MAG: hypothetical protein ACK4PK_09965 [Alphaproteobacteria bacterium]